CQQGYNFPFTF
nr:immunoglobulin light chain junction region [Macaca mulatta]MOV85224.1 immunoglobulin light chain junction region [Macaca mulatta]